MKRFKTIVEGFDKEYNFECYENTEPIELGDVYIFFFGGIADVQKCDSETVKEEINPNNRVNNEYKIDFITGFWEKCYKIKTTDFDISNC